MVTKANGVDEITQGECLVRTEQRAWGNGAANGCRKKGKPAKKQDMKKGKYDHVTLQEPEESVSRGKEWSAVSSAAERESSRLNDVRRIQLAGGHPLCAPAPHHPQ